MLNPSERGLEFGRLPFAKRAFVWAGRVAQTIRFRVSRTLHENSSKDWPVTVDNFIQTVYGGDWHILQRILKRDLENSDSVQEHRATRLPALSNAPVAFR